MKTVSFCQYLEMILVGQPMITIGGLKFQQMSPVLL